MRPAWLVALVLVFAGTTAAIKGPVTYTVDVPPGEWRSMRLRELPGGVVLGVTVEVSGEVAVAVLDSVEFPRYPAVQRPLFRGRVDGRHAFRVTTRASGDHYVVLDNRAGPAARTITVTVTAARPEPGDRARRALERQLEEFERKLGQLFVFEPFPIRVAACGAPAVTAGGGNGIVLCAEYARALRDALPDRDRARDALLLTFYQELGERLHAQWPDARSAGGPDEFATALMVMLESKERVRAKAEYFAANPAVTGAIAKAVANDPDRLSAARARAIVRWAEDGDLVRRWQKVLVPHMQTAMLERLAREPAPWADHALVEQELARRRR